MITYTSNYRHQYFKSKQLLFLVLVMSIFRLHVQALNEDQSSSSSLTQQKTLCRFRNKEYSPGDIWYPSSSSPLTTSGNSHCIRCSCLNTGRLNCTKEDFDCQAECPMDRNKSGNGNVHSCCKFCEESSSGSTSGNFLGSGTGSTTNLHGASANGNNNGGSSGNGSPFTNLGQFDSSEDMEDEDDGILEHSEYVSCLHQGKIYRDGDSFTANVSGLPIASSDQCLQCQCQGGMVLCAMKPCSSFKCGTSTSLSSLSSSPQTATQFGSVVGDTCCQRCAALKSLKKPEERGDAVVRKPTLSGGSGPPRLVYPGTFNNNPNGQKVVSAGTSPSSTASVNFIPHEQVESSVTFRDGINSNGGRGGGTGTGLGTLKKHADDCISSGRFYLHGSTWHPVIGSLGAMECVVCKCNQGQIECSRLKCPHKREMSCSKPVKIEGHCCPICPTDKDHVVIPEGSTLCVSAKQDITAYKSQGFGTNGTEIIEFAFLKPLNTNTNSDLQVELHEWTLNDGDINAFTTDYLTIPQFDALRNRQTFTLLGAANEKNLEKFTRREKKLEKRCTSRCSLRISSLERSLRLHRLIPRSNCLTHERAITTH